MNLVDVATLRHDVFPRPSHDPDRMGDAWTPPEHALYYELPWDGNWPVFCITCHTSFLHSDLATHELQLHGNRQIWQCVCSCHAWLWFDMLHMDGDFCWPCSDAGHNDDDGPAHIADAGDDDDDEYDP